MLPSLADERFHNEHGDLVNGAQSLIAHLEVVGYRIRSLDDTSYGHHDAFALRAKSLASYSRGALQLAEAGLYLPAFAVVRSAFEHHHIDKLVMLAQRDSFPAQRGSGDDAGYSLSRYYFLLNTPWDFLTYSGEGEEISAHQLWSDWFSVSVLGTKLMEEGLLSRSQSEQWQVHYSFLSRYAHPASSEQYEELFGDRVGRYDHCASELILLYICYFCSASLQDFHAMSKLPPKIRLDGWEEVASDIDMVAKLTDYAWFPGQQPHQRDRFDEALRRWGEVSDETGEDDASITVDTIDDGHTSYYADPLRRLRRLHESGVDVVGAYTSPWEVVE
ncbi:MAG: hypothetical protein F4Z77_11295 [Dehalococcoidia bacterium]|nr:hypothetical protein [Dehalococcoidia bacterium]MYA53274.1 hypothetical protein [Dehalococcoidia bacterium]